MWQWLRLLAPAWSRLLAPAWSRKMTEAMHEAKLQRPPLVAVVGATGSGKTRLGIELAKAFPAEIISADSMQVYKGLDVVTAKPTAAERAAVPHHLIDIIEPHLSFSVLDFRNRALPIIDRLMSAGKVPIVVGGTFYYVESVLWHILIEEAGAADEEQLVCERKRKLHEGEEGEAGEVGEERRLLLAELAREREGACSLSNAEWHARLRKHDSASAKRLHLNDRRKICRALEVWASTGTKQSELLAKRAETERRLRYPDSTVVLWLRANEEEHERRLYQRVDAMLEAGLVEEMLEYHRKYNKARLDNQREADYTKGIFQTLGFKEFHDYLVLSEAERNSEAGRRLLERGLLDMKRRTRRFARKQNIMVRSRFLDHPTRQIPPIYELDSSEPHLWDEKVRLRAVDIVQHHLRGTPCPYAPLLPPPAPIKTEADIHAHRFCATCRRVFIGDIQYKAHMSSNRHKRRATGATGRAHSAAPPST